MPFLKSSIHFYLPISLDTEQPERDWAQKLVIPFWFSAETNALLKTGMPTRRSRDEVVNALATLILVHTIRPTILYLQEAGGQTPCP